MDRKIDQTIDWPSVYHNSVWQSRSQYRMQLLRRQAIRKRIIRHAFQLRLITLRGTANQNKHREMSA